MINRPIKTFITQKDSFDAADNFYAPSLFTLPSVSPPQSIHRLLIGAENEYVRDQGIQPYCTAMALASVIDYLVLDRLSKSLDQSLLDHSSPASMPAELSKRCSVRMLYEMAKAFDEYPDDDNKGSSLRGAIKGFFHNGVFRRPFDAQTERDELDPFQPWVLDIETAKASRETVLGRYLRVAPNLLDYHSAIIDTGIIYVSAQIHSGWDLQNVRDHDGAIIYSPEYEPRGNHAFAVIGYNERGFLVLNSHGPDWGHWRDNLNGDLRIWPGVALWSYADWSRHLLDAWVLRLGVPVDISQFRQVETFRYAATRLSGVVSQGVTRLLINGHYLHLSDGQLVTSGVFTNDLASIQQTAELLQAKPQEMAERKYTDLIFFAESGLQSLEKMAQRCAVFAAQLLGSTAAMPSTYRPYPISVIWRQDVQEMAEDLLESRAHRMEMRTRGYADAKAHMLEAYAREYLQPLWRTFEGEAERSFLTAIPGSRSQPWEAMKTLLSAATEGASPMRVHFVVHGSGMPWFLKLVEKLASNEGSIPSLATPEQRRSLVRSINLLAPICSVKAIAKLAVHLWGSWPSDSIKPAPPLAIYRQPAERDATENLAGFSGSFLELARRCFPLDGHRPTFSKANNIAGHADDSKLLQKEKILAGLLDFPPTPTHDGTGHADLLADPLLMEAVLNRIQRLSMDT